MAQRKFPEQDVAEQLTPALAGALRAAGVTADVAHEGRGVHWHVTAVAGARSCRIHCFYYGDVAGALVLGVMGNAHLRNVAAQRPPVARRGAEYLTMFEDDGQERASGRTQDLAATLDTATRWLAGASLESVYAAHDHVDRELRAHRALAADLEAGLASRQADAVVKIERDLGPSFELWVYARDRACQLAALADGTVGCALLIHTTQVLRVEVATGADALEVVDGWVRARNTIAGARQGHATADVSPHGELLEAGDVSGWLWANLLAGATDGGSDVLRFYRPLIQEIRERPVASSFFAFTSLYTLCFSMCSHYPFETRSMPTVTPVGDGDEHRYRARAGDRTCEGSASDVADFLEEALSRIEATPWHGVSGEALIEPINDALAERGSTLRARRVQRQQWWSVEIESARGVVRIDGARNDKACCGLAFAPAAGEHEHRNPTTLRKAVEHIERWLTPHR